MSQGLILSEKRSLERRELIYYLRVRDLATGKDLGRMVDIHNNGLLIMGSISLPPEKVYNMSMEMPKAMMEQGINNVNIKAKVMWSRPSKTTNFMENGMKFIDPSEETRRSIDKLIEFFALPNGTFNLS
ncbi:MAG: PilZ domain-containing protein [Deltaproteobacteria bacterium]|jgi:hypothetical protein|nr:PilZ domain-containing protein [Deltaproteobacteria bacterium]